jgi:hypothetical protein
LKLVIMCFAARHKMATACVNARIICSLFAAAIIFACAIAALPVDGAPQSAADDGSSSADEFRGSASSGRNYASRIHQLQLITAARHGLARLVPVLDRMTNATILPQPSTSTTDGAVDDSASDATAMPSVWPAVSVEASPPDMTSTTGIEVTSPLW